MSKVGGKLEDKLARWLGRAIDDFQLIEEGDRILVGLSGGKDSYALLVLLEALRRKAPICFEVAAVNLDPGYAGYRKNVVEEFARAQGVVIHMIAAPIEELVAKNLAPGKIACPLCSRIRRGAFYTLAKRAGYSKIALGHHLDDMIETFLLNFFYAGSLRGMPPKLERDAGLPVVIRPLCYLLEADLETYARTKNFPIIPCASPHCGGETRRRQVIKEILTTLESEHPDIKTQARRALGNLQPSTLFLRTPSKA